jgi:hypothetical protein
MVDLFSLNFVGPTLSTVKGDKRKGVQFVPREHASIYNFVANIY